MRYERRHDGQYVLVETQQHKILLQTYEPALLFDRSTGTLLKHGDIDFVRKIKTDMEAKYRRIGAIDLAKDLVLLSSRMFDTEELNHCINIADYCGRLYERITKQ